MRQTRRGFERPFIKGTQVAYIVADHEFRGMTPDEIADGHSQITLAAALFLPRQSRVAPAGRHVRGTAAKMEAMAVKFHLDENLEHAIARGLRRRDIDCSTTTDAELVSGSDRDQLAFAISQGRVLITRDSDFVALHAAMFAGGEEHAGIVYFVNSSSKHFGTLV